VLARFVAVEAMPEPTRYVVGHGCKLAGSRGTAVAVIRLKRSSGYEIVMKLDDGRLESFDPMRLFLEMAA